MVNIPYEEIVKKIKEKSDLSDEELDAKIKEKMDQLSGLISKDGAAYIVANDLGVKLVESEGPVKIKDIYSGMRALETVGKVVRIFPVNEFERNGMKGRVGSFILADETGQIRVTLWNDKVELLSDFNLGDILKIKEGFAKENMGRKEIHMNSNSKIVINPEGITINVDVQENQEQQQEAKRKKISEISENDMNVEILGTVVQVFDPKFFPQCPQCNKKLTQNSESFTCNEHGNVEPKYGNVMNIVIDDGTDNIRAVFFGNATLQVTNKTQEQMNKLRENPENFEEVKTSLLGETIKIEGRVKRNQMFDRLEVIANKVTVNVDPRQEIKKIQEESGDGGNSEHIPSIDEL